MASAGNKNKYDKYVDSLELKEPKHILRFYYKPVVYQYDDFDALKHMFKQNHYLYKIRNDRNFFLAFVIKHPIAFQLIADNFRNDKDFVYEVVQNIKNHRDFELILRFIGDDLRKNEDIFTIAISEDPSILEFAADTLKENAEFIMTAIKSIVEKSKILAGKNFRSIDIFRDDIWQQDHLFTYKVIMKCIRYIVMFTSPKLLADFDFVVNIIMAPVMEIFNWPYHRFLDNVIGQYKYSEDNTMFTYVNVKTLVRSHLVNKTQQPLCELNYVIPEIFDKIGEYATKECIDPIKYFYDYVHNRYRKCVNIAKIARETASGTDVDPFSDYEFNEADEAAIANGTGADLISANEAAIAAITAAGMGADDLAAAAAGAAAAKSSITALRAVADVYDDPYVIQIIHEALSIASSTYNRISKSIVVTAFVREKMCDLHATGEYKGVWPSYWQVAQKDEYKFHVARNEEDTVAEWAISIYNKKLDDYKYQDCKNGWVTDLTPPNKKTPPNSDLLLKYLKYKIKYLKLKNNENK